MDPRPTGVAAPTGNAVTLATIVALFGALVVGCGSEADKQMYDPVALGMVSTDAPSYDDGETQLYEVRRPLSLPILSPTDMQRAALDSPVPPYDRTPWITNKDIRVQVSWTLSNLDDSYHNIEILLDPWNEFARYVPAVNVGDNEVTPDLSGIDLLIRVEGRQRKTGTFTFDDMDEVATDLATVQNILIANPPSGAPPVPGMSDGVNGMINHAFDIHNRSNDNDPLIQRYIPSTIAGLVGFDLGLRLHDQGTVAIEILVEIEDVAGNRVIADAPLKIDGTMWITPDATVTAPMGAVR
jgi:hypothetical protein